MRNSKSVLFTTIFFQLALAVFAQKGKNTIAPPEATSAFAKAFPLATAIKWEKEKGNYEVNFRQNGQTMSALYDAAGKLQETEQDIKIAELPAGVVDYIKQNYKGATVKEAAKITKANGDINYEAEVNKQDLLFDTRGKFIKAVKD